MVKLFFATLVALLALANPASAVQLCNKAWMDIVSTGTTDPMTLGSAVAGSQSFADCGITDGQIVSYSILDGSAWEVGTGTYTSAGTTLSRSVIESSNSDTEISMTANATVLVAPLKSDLPAESTPTEASPTASDYVFILQSGAFERSQISALESALEGFLDAADLQGDIALTTDTSGNYAAGDAEAGAALTGDSATAFFSAGTIELARGGTSASLADPGGNRIIAWDDTANNVEFQDAGTGLTAGTTTLDCDASTDSAVGCVELATTGEAETGTDTSRAVTAAGVLAAVTGKKPIWLPAGALVPRTTNGCVINDLELATNDIMLRTCDFDQTAEEGAGFTVKMPNTWDEGTLTAVFVWTHPSTATNFGVVWGISCLATSNDDAMDATLGTQQTVTDTGGTTSDQYTSPATSAVTCAGSPAADDTIYFEIERIGGNGSDNLAVDAMLLGVTIYYTDSAFVEP